MPNDLESKSARSSDDTQVISAELLAQLRRESRPPSPPTLDLAHAPTPPHVRGRAS